MDVFVKADGGRDFARRANELRMATAGGRRPPLRMRPKDGVGAAFGRPPGRAPRFLSVIPSVLFVILSEAKNP